MKQHEARLLPRARHRLRSARSSPIGTIPELHGPFVMRDPGTTYMRATGTIEAASTPVTIDACQSGEHHGYYGVDVFARDTRYSRMRVLVDPLTGQVRVTLVIDPATAGVRVLIVPHARSTTLTSLARKACLIGHVALMRGHANLDCTYDDGHVRATVAFDGCS